MNCRSGFFLPVRILSRLFRGKFLHGLTQAFHRGLLGFHGRLAHLRQISDFRSYLSPLYKKEWFVYAKPPFSGPRQVLRYLARYTHRVAISNSRLVSMEGDSVTFTWKDYAHACRQRSLTVSALEFLRRFLLHILPKGFMRIRHYGFLANRHRKEKVELCRRLLAAESEDGKQDAELYERAPTEPSDPRELCPACKRGILVCVSLFSAGEMPSPIIHDTS